jgi:hypothetical protein
MFGRTLSGPSGVSPTRLMIGALALGLLSVPVPLGAASNALECDSDLTISFPAGNTAIPGGTVEVQLEVEWGLARDSQDNNVDIDFSNVNFVSACDPSNPPPGCAPDPAAPVTYVSGSAVTTCDPGTMTPTAVGSEVNFDFAPPPGFNLGPDPPTPPPPPAVGETCTINFDVMVGAGVAAPASILVEAASTGVCNIGAPGNDASSSNTATLEIIPDVPFSSAGALVILALLLLAGSLYFVMLRRRSGEKLT